LKNRLQQTGKIWPEVGKQEMGPVEKPILGGGFQQHLKWGKKTVIGGTELIFGIGFMLKKIKTKQAKETS